MKNFWNERYGKDEFIYGKQPNIFFAEQIVTLDPGKLLLPAEGEGRNAVYAAGLGWEVTAFDFSEAGKQKAEKLAEETGVNIRYHIAQATDFQAEAESYDAIALVYAHFLPEVRKKAHQQAVDWLKPGGRLIVEAFHPRQMKRNSGGPRNPEMLYSKEILSEDFSALKEVLLEEKVIQLSEGKHHEGEADVVRFVGERKA